MNRYCDKFRVGLEDFGPAWLNPGACRARQHPVAHVSGTDLTPKRAATAANGLTRLLPCRSCTEGTCHTPGTAQVAGRPRRPPRDRVGRGILDHSIHREHGIILHTSSIARRPYPNCRSHRARLSRHRRDHLCVPGSGSIRARVRTCRGRRRRRRTICSRDASGARLLSSTCPR